MIVNPAVIGLVTCSFLASAAAIQASFIGIQIIRGWDISSGSEKQITLERKTYLVSTFLNYVMGCELLSLFLFVSMADRMHTLFIGAMCAAGTLNANLYGYPTLMLKTTNFLLCGVFIIINYLDNKGFDYPLIRFKYGFMLGITPLILLETVFLFQYQAGLEPEIITSCCGALFGEGADKVASEVAHLPSLAMKMVFYVCLALTLIAGARFCAKGKGAISYSILNAGLFVISLASVISFISLYFYELPTHHCPFCLLQKDYHYIGYVLYLSLFIASIAGVSVGIIDRFKGIPSLMEISPIIQKRFCFVSMAAHVVFAAISTYPILFSDFLLEGY